MKLSRLLNSISNVILQKTDFDKFFLSKSVFLYSIYLYLLLLLEEVLLEDERDVDEEVRFAAFELDEVDELLRTEEVDVCAFFTVVDEERFAALELDEVDELLRTDEAGVCAFFTAVDVEERFTVKEERPEELPLCTFGVDVRAEEEVADVVLLTVVAPEVTPVEEEVLLDDELCADVRVGVEVRCVVLLLLEVTGVDVRCVVFTRLVEVPVEELLVEVDTREG